MGRLFDSRLCRADASDARRARLVRLVAGGTGDDPSALARALAAELGVDETHEPAALGPLVAALDDADLDAPTRARVWTELAEMLPQSFAVWICVGDALHADGRARDAADAVVRAFEGDPRLVEDFADDAAELARAAGGDIWLRYQLAELRGRLEAAQDEDEGANSSSGDPAEIRERYSEILEEWRDAPAALERIRAVGQRIRQLEVAGVLPRVMVRRGSWRPR